MTRDDVIAAFEAMLERAGEDLPRKGRTMPYSAVNGNMFVFVDPEGTLCLRLGKDDKAAYEAEFGTGDVIQYNAVMRGYVPVVPGLLADTGQLDAWFARAVANVRALKPKPTRK